MINTIIGAVLGLCFFIVPVLAYREGIRVGMQLSKGIEPPKVQSPIEVVKEVVKEVHDIKLEQEQAKADKKYNDDIAKLMAYYGGGMNGESQ